MRDEHILTELRAIRELLEWDKADTLALRARHAEDEQRFKAEQEEMLERALASAKQNAIDVYRMQFREHEERYHGRPKQQNEIAGRA